MIKGSEWNGGKKYKKSFVEVKKEVKEIQMLRCRKETLKGIKQNVQEK